MAYVELFDVENGVLIPTKHCYALKFLKDIMDEYPNDYIEIYKYVFYMTCPYRKHNPYFNVASDVREEEILKQINLKISLDNSLIETAKQELEKLFDSRLAQAYKAMAIGVENVATYVRTTKPSGGRDGTLSGLLKAITDYPKMREAFEKVENAFLESQSDKTVRGGADVAYDQIDSR